MARISRLAMDFARCRNLLLEPHFGQGPIQSSRYRIHRQPLVRSTRRQTLNRVYRGSMRFAQNAYDLQNKAQKRPFAEVLRAIALQRSGI